MHKVAFQSLKLLRILFCGRIKAADTSRRCLPVELVLDIVRYASEDAQALSSRQWRALEAFAADRSTLALLKNMPRHRFKDQRVGWLRKLGLFCWDPKR